MATAIRCTLPGCSCECFNPCKSQLRTCQSCQHGWVAHALDKLASRALFPSLQFHGVQTSDVFDMASLLLYGAHAVPIRCKIMLDQLFHALNRTDMKQILEGLGWNENDYMTGYMSLDGEGKLRSKWQQTTYEEELIILNQFLRFSETKSMAEQMISDIQQQKVEKSLPQSHESNIQAFITNLQKSQRQSSDVTTSRTLSCASSNQHMHPVNGPTQTSVITQSSNEHSTNNCHLGSLANRVAPFALSLVHNKEQMNERLQSKYTEMYPFPHKKMRPNYSLLNKERTQHCESENERYKTTKERYIPGQDTYRHDMFTPSICPSVPSMVCITSRVNVSTTNTDHFHTSTVAESMVPHCATSREFGPLTSSPIPHTTTSQYKYLPSPLSLPYPKESLPCNVNNRPSFSDENMHMDDSASTEGTTNSEENTLNDFSTSSAANVQDADQNIDNSWLMSNSSKRVLCNICQKWFYDKGTWKIHFGAVHLKVKYHCTVEGCNMTFSSIRSRNRHSSNPNPKIHKSVAVHRKAYTRKNYTCKVPMIELSSNTTPQEGTDSEESCNDEEQHQLNKENYAYSNTMECKPVNTSSDGGNQSNHSATHQDMHTDHPNQLQNLASSKEFVLSGLPFSKRYMQTLKTEPEYNIDESQANKRKSTVPVKYQSTHNDPEDMVDSATEDEDQVYGDDNHSNTDVVLTTDVSPCLASSGTKTEMEQHDSSALTERIDIKPVIPKEQSIADANIQRTEPASPSLDQGSAIEGFGMAGPLPPTPDSSDHCHEGKVSEDFQFNMVSPKEKEELTSTPSSWPVIESIEQRTQEVLPGGVVVVDHPSTTREGQGLVCELCRKTYSCKETLKTHYKSIHLREMHMCTVPGCGNMFPSVRSRNRHSQNMKLHSGLIGLDNNIPSNTHNLTPNHTHSLTTNPPLTESIPSY